MPKSFKVLTIVLLLINTTTSNAQKHILNEDGETQILYAYVDNDSSHTRSNMGFIRKRYKNKTPSKVIIDTTFFRKKLREKNHQPYVSGENNMSIDTLENHILKYYLLYDFSTLDILNKTIDKNLNTDKVKPWFHYFPKDSLPLQGYFELPDFSKEAKDEVSEPNKYNPNRYVSDIARPSYFRTRYTKGSLINGLKHGKWTIMEDYYFAKIEEHYKNGVRDGLYSVYDKNNAILYQTNFKNGTGEERTYRLNNSLHSIIYYANNMIDTTIPTVYFYNNGQAANSYDTANKTIKHYYKSGTLFSETEVYYKNGFYWKHGTHLEYNRKEVLKEKSYYYLSNDSSYRIKYDDKEILELFNKSLNSNIEIKEEKNSGFGSNNKIANLTISSSKMVKDLKKYGIVENKTDTINFYDFKDINLIKNYIREIFDGDGWCYFSSNSREIGLSGNK